MSTPTLTIIIATYNSEKTLPLVLKALERQTYPKKNIEILLVDGGSIDKTHVIGKKFHCTFLNNPRTEPVYGKYIAYLHAKGKYVLYLDHDEVLENKNSISLKLDAFKRSPDIKAVISSGYKNPPGYPFINNYINEFGDPFSFFLYKLSKDTRFFIPIMKKRYPVLFENNESITLNLSHIKSLPIIELVAGGSMFDREFFQKTYPQTMQKMQLLPHFFYLLYTQYPYITITKNDSLLHYSADSYEKYLTKIAWRVKNNIYHTAEMGTAGFTGRNNFQPTIIKYKKYFFILYSFSIIPPLLDGLYLSYSRKNIFYIIHVPLCIYTSGLILFHYSRKLMGNRPKLRNYDNTKEVV